MYRGGMGRVLGINASGPISGHHLGRGDRIKTPASVKPVLDSREVHLHPWEVREPAQCKPLFELGRLVSHIKIEKTLSRFSERKSCRILWPTEDLTEAG